MPDTLLAWSTPPREVTFERVLVFDRMGLPEERLRQLWSEPAFRNGRVEYDVVTDKAGEEGGFEILDTQRMFYGRDGFGVLGPVDDDGVLHAWDPPMLVLPPQPKHGMTWTAEHRRDDQTVTRTCEIGPSNLCVAGLVTVCDRDGGGVRQVTRDHFCPEIGWVGFEALIRREGQPTQRSWSQGLVRDGLFIPDPPD